MWIEVKGKMKRKNRRNGGMVCLQVGVEQQLYNTRKSICFNGFCNSYFNFQCSKHLPTKVTQIIKNLSFLLLLLDVLFYYSIFSVSLLFYVPLFHFHPQGSPFYHFLFFCFLQCFFAFACFVSWLWVYFCNCCLFISKFLFCSFSFFQHSRNEKHTNKLG